MDVCMNVSVSSECQQEELSTLDDLFPSHNTEVDFGMEWLSVFVEDCFSSKPSCLLAAAPSGVVQTTNTTKPSNTTMQKNNQSCLQNFAVPGKARSKRKRLSAPRRIKDNTLSTTTTWSQQSDCSDHPLLKQAYWLADSELINVPKKNKDNNEQKGVVAKGKESLLGDNICDDEVVETTNNNNNSGDEEEGEQNQMIPRRCTHCMAQRTPQWRGGPMGPKTLCNACGVRYKSGRLLPEYRPAKSPTFVTYLHSNSHKKVLEMRNMATTLLPSSSSSSNIIPTDEK